MVNSKKERKSVTAKAHQQPPKGEDQARSTLNKITQGFVTGVSELSVGRYPRRKESGSLWVTVVTLPKGRKENQTYRLKENHFQQTHSWNSKPHRSESKGKCTLQSWPFPVESTQGPQTDHRNEKESVVWLNLKRVNHLHHLKKAESRLNY